MTAYERKTGPGYAYILCDVCGQKIYQKDAILISDKYNLYYGLLVCEEDADKTNPQAIPYSVSETQIQNPKLLRSERPDVNTTNSNSNRVPGAPTLLTATLHPINATIVLQWQGPVDSGSDPITGYVITRAVPQATVQQVLVDNTGSASPYYEDTSSSLSQDSTYTVRAINAYGTGTDSNLAYFPTVDTPLVLTTKYLTTGDGHSIETGQGDFIIIENAP